MLIIFKILDDVTVIVQLSKRTTNVHKVNGFHSIAFIAKNLFPKYKQVTGPYFAPFMHPECSSSIWCIIHEQRTQAYSWHGSMSFTPCGSPVIVNAYKNILEYSSQQVGQGQVFKRFWDSTCSSLLDNWNPACMQTVQCLAVTDLHKIINLPSIMYQFLLYVSNLRATSNLVS